MTQRASKPWRRGRRQGPKCPQTGKDSYQNRAAADWTMRQIWATNRPGPMPIRAYRCPFCDLYHLTKQPRKS